MTYSLDATSAAERCAIDPGDVFPTSLCWMKKTAVRIQVNPRAMPDGFPAEDRPCTHGDVQTGAQLSA